MVFSVVRFLSKTFNFYGEWGLKVWTKWEGSGVIKFILEEKAKYVIMLFFSFDITQIGMKREKYFYKLK